MTLCIWPVAPDADGDGASQRAWYMLRALAKVEPVDLVILQQTDRPALAQTSLGQASAIARSVRFVPVPEWRTTSSLHPIIPNALGRVLDQPRIMSVETPRLSRQALARIADQLPAYADTVFAGRLSVACIVDDLCRAGMLHATRRWVDFDDIMSRFRRLQLKRQQLGTVMRCWQSLIAHQMEQAEARIARSWDGCAVASGDDVAVVANAHPGARVVHLPNVVERTMLSPPADGPLRLLFVGNLGYPPNRDGLRFFLEQVWPSLRHSHPEIALTVVGRAPDDALAAQIRAAGVALHVNVPSVVPFYAQAHAVIAPIFFGGGTRVKIIEAMAFGKPIVATRFGVEGLAVCDGVHALLGDTSAELCHAIVSLARDPLLGGRLGERAHRLQQERYGSGTLDDAVQQAMRFTAPAPYHADRAAGVTRSKPRLGWMLQEEGAVPA